LRALAHELNECFRPRRSRDLLSTEEPALQLKALSSIRTGFPFEREHWCRRRRDAASA
jgi:hypothetical protein